MNRWRYYISNSSLCSGAQLLMVMKNEGELTMQDNDRNVLFFFYPFVP